MNDEKLGGFMGGILHTADYVSSLIFGRIVLHDSMILKLLRRAVAGAALGAVLGGIIAILALLNESLDLIVVKELKGGRSKFEAILGGSIMGPLVVNAVTVVDEAIVWWRSRGQCNRP